ncbi:mechanosensitive ion channel family protein [Opitutaceae bacterium]
MQGLIELIQRSLIEHQLDPDLSSLAARGIGFLVLVLLAWMADLLAKRIILRAITGLIRRTTTTWDNAMLEAGVFTRLCHFLPALVFQVFGSDVLGETPKMLLLLDTLVTLYLIFAAMMVVSATINAIQVIVSRGKLGSRVPLKGFAQGIKLVAALIGGIYMLSVLLNKSPVYIFSGMGALTAVLLLIFKDALLGFVAGIQISVNQMVQIGDWIEMPKAGADGFVIDVSLTTVKVQNWDKTITTIPTYALISESFKNWRGMFESGGRRIKRAIHIDLQTITFATETMLERWRRMRLLRPYLAEKLAEIEKENQQLNEELGVLGNGRRLTNLGTFRAYCIAYLRSHAGINQDMLLIVRQLAPTEHGLPLELYTFTRDVRWVVHESVQADIFDHLLAIVPQFDLRVFQQPSGADFKGLIGNSSTPSLPAR